MVGMLRRHAGLLLGSGLLILAILGLSSWLLREPTLLDPTDPVGGAADGGPAAAAAAYVCRVVDDEGRPCAGVQVGAWLHPAPQAVARFGRAPLEDARGAPPSASPPPMSRPRPTRTALRALMDSRSSDSPACARSWKRLASACSTGRLLRAFSVARKRLRRGPCSASSGARRRRCAWSTAVAAEFRPSCACGGRRRAASGGGARP